MRARRPMRAAGRDIDHLLAWCQPKLFEPSRAMTPASIHFNLMRAPPRNMIEELAIVGGQIRTEGGTGRTRKQVGRNAEHTVMVRRFFLGEIGDPGAATCALRDIRSLGMNKLDHVMPVGCKMQHAINDL